jgi:RimJ/RimL family protein N-acetyltransferase
MLSQVHDLDGVHLRLRLTRPSDAPRVRAFLERLSPETRQRRFFSAMPEIDERTVRHFTFFDPRERLVVAATAPEAGVEEIVALADVAHLETGVAELAIVVDERHQRRGIGRLLGEAMATLAARQGATHMKAELLERNAGMMRVMEYLGQVTREADDGNVVVYAKLPPAVRRAA